MTEKTTSLANAGSLGLLGFGMTTILLNLHNAGFLPLSITIVSMGIALGGLAQFIAGLIEFKNHNMFGGTAFTAYGLFWWSLVIIWHNPFAPTIAGADNISMGFYLLLWFVLTLFFFIGTLKHNRVTQLVFGTLALLFLLLAVGDFSELSLVTTIAGYVGIVCGAIAVYGALAQVVNNEFKRDLLPLG